MMRHWKGQVAVKAGISPNTLNLGVKIGCGSRITFIPNCGSKTGCVVSMVDNEFQSQPCLTIQHTNDETVEGSYCCEFLNQSKHTQSAWCEKWVIALPHLSPLMAQEQVVVSMVDNKFQSQPCLTIQYTNDETMEGSSCCELLELVHTHMILV